MKNIITSLSTVQRNKEMVTSNIDGEIVMMSVESGEYYGLDEIGSRIWEIIENKIKVDELITRLLDEFEVDKTICENDTLDFLNELLSKNLISLVSNGNT